MPSIFPHLNSLTISILLACNISATYATDLYVFYPTDIRPKSLQKQINTICPDIDIVAFGRSVDFYRKIKQAPPNAILSLEPVVSQKQPFSTINGLRNNQDSEEYFLVSINTPVDIKNIEQLKIGVLDVLGRKPTKEFIRDLFSRNIDIKRVVKPEDFLPLLTFKLADAIFIPERTLNKLQKKSRQKLVATKTGIYLGLATTGFLNQKNNKIARCLKKMDAKTNALLDIDHWDIKL